MEHEDGTGQESEGGAKRHLALPFRPRLDQERDRPADDGSGIAKRRQRMGWVYCCSPGAPLGGCANSKDATANLEVGARAPLVGI